MHVFIQAGLDPLLAEHQNLSMLEVGWGTGLNALLTYFEAPQTSIRYTGIEAEPIDYELIGKLNYPEFVTAADEREAEDVLQRLHQAPWDTWTPISDRFAMYKAHVLLQDFQASDAYDLIYFDAFAPNAQPELWTREIFEQLFAVCKPGAILTTYSAKGDVRRALIAAGFEVEKLPGPPGKREMLRARVPIPGQGASTPPTGEG